jgi:hypothetical protein
MEHEELRQHATVDEKTAQEALALALRLQSQNGPRISIDELNRTADEAGIDRAYVASALQQLSSPPQVIPDQHRSLARMALSAGISAAIIACMVVSFQGHRSDRAESFIILFVSALVAGTLARLIARKRCRLRRGGPLL